MPVTPRRRHAQPGSAFAMECEGASPELWSQLTRLHLAVRLRLSYLVRLLLRVKQATPRRVEKGELHEETFDIGGNRWVDKHSLG